MERKRQGFLIRRGDRYYIDGNRTPSILINQLQIDLLQHFQTYCHGHLLDVGCGERPYRLLYDDLVESSIGIDVENCVHDRSDIDLFASADNLPFENMKFDTVLCTNVLEHVAEAGKGFWEICRVLKNGGVFIGITPFLYPVHEAPYDFFRYTPYGLHHLMEKNGMKIIHLLPLGGFGLMIVVYFNLFVTRLLKWSPLISVNIAMQKAFYPIYKKVVFRNILNGGGKVSNIISCGYLFIALKESDGWQSRKGEADDP